MLAQVQDMLDQVQIDQKKIKINFTEFCLINLCRECLDLISLQAEAKGLKTFLRILNLEAIE